MKTNLGHLESAAGAAGILKSLVALKSGRLPAHLNFKTPNPHIDWDTISVRVPTEGQAWPKMDGPRLSGVSSFGFSGTNAHIILEQPHVAEAAAPTEHLSGKCSHCRRVVPPLLSAWQARWLRRWKIVIIRLRTPASQQALDAHIFPHAWLSRPGLETTSFQH
ncbi:MAG: hypothetical protein CMF04_09445 [Hyphomonas sp.]|nr:hypothetical protein [Hyphomonas sp.]